MGEGQNPLAHPAIGLVLDGIARVWAVRERRQRAERGITLAITPQILADLRVAWPTQEPEASMLWAAATLACYAALRPSELLGSAQHRDRALKAESISFLRRDGAILSRATAGAQLPDRFTIQLGPTKTDQRGFASAKVVAGATAVEALWRWCGMREAFGITSPLLFACEGCAPLAATRLFGTLRQACLDTGRGKVKITGKCFRRGGASGLVGQGVPNADVARVVGWASVRTVETYTDQAALERRALVASRRMEPAAAGRR